jgi:RNA polymerase sigma factor (sigma-70 family)
MSTILGRLAIPISTLVPIPVDLLQWLSGARTQCRDDRTKLLTFCRSYLEILGKRRLPRDWQAKEDPDDVVQEALAKFNRKFGQLRNLTVEGLLAFLHRIWKTTLLNLQRRYRDAQKRAAGCEQAWTEAMRDQAVSGALTPLKTMIDEENREEVTAAVGRLPEKLRLVIVWHYQEGRSFAEIGERLGITEHAAQQRHRKTLKLLEKDLPSRE